MPNVAPDQADTYKCFAVNEYGQAVVTVVLNVIAGENHLKANIAEYISMANWEVLANVDLSLLFL